MFYLWPFQDEWARAPPVSLVDFCLASVPRLYVLSRAFSAFVPNLHSKTMYKAGQDLF